MSNRRQRVYEQVPAAAAVRSFFATLESLLLVIFLQLPDLSIHSSTCLPSSFALFNS